LLSVHRAVGRGRGSRGAGVEPGHAESEEPGGARSGRGRGGAAGVGAVTRGHRLSQPRAADLPSGRAGGVEAPGVGKSQQTPAGVRGPGRAGES
jgi:hypothetical protein